MDGCMYGLFIVDLVCDDDDDNHDDDGYSKWQSSVCLSSHSVTSILYVCAHYNWLSTVLSTFVECSWWCCTESRMKR